MLERGDEALVGQLLSRFGGYESAEPQEFLDDPRTLLIVAMEDGEPAGWLYAYELVRPEGRRTMLLYEIEVAGEAQGRGHGRALIEALLTEARERNHFKVWVLTDSANEAAEALYSATGGGISQRVMFSWELP